jgi:hypothetical protein
VFAPATAAGVGGQEDSRHRDENDADRNVDAEDPVPARAFGQQAAGEYADRRRRPGDGAVEAERAIALGAFRESHGEDRECGRRDERQRQSR